MKIYREHLIGLVFGLTLGSILILYGTSKAHHDHPPAPVAAQPSP